MTDFACAVLGPTMGFFFGFLSATLMFYVAKGRSDG
jgi:hypothetical protein